MAKINGVDLDELVKCEEGIIKDFGSLCVFAAMTRIPYPKILDMFRRSVFDLEFFERVVKEYEFYLSRRKEGDVPYRISDKERSDIRITILTHFNSYTDFCKEYEKYDVVYITNVVKGNLKRKSKKYLELATLLKEEYDLEIETEFNYRKNRFL